MDSFCKLIWSALVGLFRSRASLQAENLVLRHQLNVLRRKFPQRITSSTIDRLLFAGLYALVPSVLDALQIVKPDTVIRWHRHGFRAYWRWKSGSSRGGRPGTPTEIRQLIRRMSIANPFWDAPRIHGELLKLGIDVSQTTVAKYMAKARRPPSQGWRTFLHNHADGIAFGSFVATRTIIMKFGRTGHWTKMRRDIARSTVTWRRSAVSLAAWSVARGASDRGVGALAQGGYGVKQLTAMPDRSDTKVLQVLRRQTRQDCLVDIILAECRLILFEAK